MSIKTNERACVHITFADGTDVSEEWMDPHWDPASLQGICDAVDMIQDMVKEAAEDGQPFQRYTLTELGYVCSELICDGCGYLFDEDGDGGVHDDAENLAEMAGDEHSGWKRVGDLWLCPGDDCRDEASRVLGETDGGTDQ